MALVGRRNGRNFGYGRQLSYAGQQALKDLFGGSHFATVRAHSDRWLAFVKWCRSEQGPGYNDARQIDWRTLFNYARYLRQQIEHGDLSIASAQNRLSSVNRTLAALRGDQYVKVPSPSQELGQQRSTVRTSAPNGQDRQQVLRVIEALREQQYDRWPRLSFWPEKQVCVCEKRSWLTCHDCNAKPKTWAVSTSRMALKAGGQVR